MQWRAYLLLCITTLFWGGNLTVGKLAVGHVSPMMLNSLRWGIAAIIIAVFSMPKIRRDWPIIRKNWPIFFGYGAIGFTGFNAFMYAGLHYTSAINASIEQTGTPLVIFALNFLLFRVRASLAQMLGFTLTLLGVAVAISHGDLIQLRNLNINPGDILLLLAVLCYASYAVCLRYKPMLNWQPMMMACFVGAFIASIPLTVSEAALGHMILPHNLIGFGAILYTALFPSMVSQVLFIRGVEIIGANRAGLFINLIPVFGMLLSVFFLGESLEPFHILAFFLAIGGIAFAEMGKPRRI